MSFVGVGEMIEVLMIGVGETERIVETFWIGAAGIRVLVMRLGMKARTEETCWTGTVGTLETVMWFGTSAVSFLT